jgi:hypothetical protein
VLIDVKLIKIKTMKKQLLFGFAALTVLIGNAQKSSKMIANPKAKKMETFKAMPTAEANLTLPSSAIASKAAAAPYKRIGGSTNVLSVIVTEQRNLNYLAATNTTGFIHRAGANTIGSLGSVGNSGTIMYTWTNNNGTTWDSTILATSATQFNRYPTGAMYNPTGNTSPSNVYAVGSGPWHPGANWQGNFFASKQLGTGYTATPGSSIYMNNLALTGAQKKNDFSRIEMQVTNNGVARVLGGLYTDANSTTAAGQAWRGAMINKGTFSAGAFTWIHDSLKPSFKVNLSGEKQSYSSYQQAWSENGLIGYVYFFGVDANALPNTSMNSFQPYVYKTSNGGTTWARHAALFNFTTLSAVNARVIDLNSAGLAKPFIAPGEGASGTVDVSGNLHLFVSMGSAYSDNIDSLGYTYSPNYNQVWNYLFDFKTTSTGWDAMIIDSLNCAGPSAAQSNWTSTTGNIVYDARLQISRTPDGNNIFYSWADSDSNIVSAAVPHVSTSPDIFMKGYHVPTNKMTCRKNMTSGKVAIQSNAYFFYASPIVAKPNVSTYLIPTTVTQGAGGLTNGDAAVNYYYIDDNTFTQSEFNVNVNIPGCVAGIPTGIKEESAVVSNLNFYPNPASTNGTIEVVLAENAKMDIVVLNSVGQTVYTTSANGIAGSNKVNVDLNNLSSGLYFYQVKIANSKSITKKFVVGK